MIFIPFMTIPNFTKLRFILILTSWSNFNNLEKSFIRLKIIIIVVIDIMHLIIMISFNFKSHY